MGLVVTAPSVSGCLRLSAPWGASLLRRLQHGSSLAVRARGWLGLGRSTSLDSAGLGSPRSPGLPGVRASPLQLSFEALALSARHRVWDPVASPLVPFDSPSKTLRIAYGSCVASVSSVPSRVRVHLGSSRALSLGVLKVRPSVVRRSRSPLPPLLPSKLGGRASAEACHVLSVFRPRRFSRPRRLAPPGRCEPLGLAADLGIHHVSGRFVRCLAPSCGPCLQVPSSGELRHDPSASVSRHPRRSREPPGDPCSRPLFSPCSPLPRPKARSLRAGACLCCALASSRWFAGPSPGGVDLCARSCELPRQARAHLLRHGVSYPDFLGGVATPAWVHHSEELGVGVGGIRRVRVPRIPDAGPGSSPPPDFLRDDASCLT